MNKDLEELFSLLCEDFKKLLQDRDGMGSADRKLLLEFLRDNEVKCVGEKNPHVRSVLDNLPFEDTHTTHQ